jgi:hypothetical protein
MSKMRKTKKWLIKVLCIYVLSYLFLSRISLYINGFHNLLLFEKLNVTKPNVR